MNKKEINPDKIQCILDPLLTPFLPQLPSERHRELVSTILNKPEAKLELLKKDTARNKIWFSLLEILFQPVTPQWASDWMEQVVASTQIWTSKTEWKSRMIFMPVWEALSDEEKRKLVFGECEKKDAERINDLICQEIHKIHISELNGDVELDNKWIKRSSDNEPSEQIIKETPETIVVGEEDKRQKLAELPKLRKKQQLLRCFSGLDLQIIMRIQKASQSISDINVAKKIVAQECRIDPNRLDILWFRYEKVVDKLKRE